MLVKCKKAYQLRFSMIQVGQVLTFVNAKTLHLGEIVKYEDVKDYVEVLVDPEPSQDITTSVDEANFVAVEPVKTKTSRKKKDLN